MGKRQFSRTPLDSIGSRTGNSSRAAIGHGSVCGAVPAGCGCLRTRLGAPAHSPNRPCVTLRLKAMFGAQSGHSRKRRDVHACALSLRALLPRWRASATSLLLFCFLLPHVSFYIQLSEAGKPRCGMACCRRSGICCCHKRSGPQSRNAGPAWTPSSHCQCGCGQTPAIVPTAGPSLASVRIELIPTVLLTGMPAISNPPNRPSSHSFSLFQRPPPPSHA